MLGTLEQSQKADWKKYISSLVFAYNCTPHEATKVAPYELMFGRKPRLPIDTVFENARPEPIQNKEAKSYIQDIQERMTKTREIVDEHVEKSKSKQKKYFDKKAKAVQIKVGDSVLVRRMAFDGKHKIQDRFEEDTYEVIEQPCLDIPVFRVKSGDKIRVLHRNLLFLVRAHDRPEEDEVQDSKTSTSLGVDASEKRNVENSNAGKEQDGVVVTHRNGDAHIPTSESSTRKVVGREDHTDTSDSESEEEWVMVEKTDVGDTAGSGETKEDDSKVVSGDTVLGEVTTLSGAAEEDDPTVISGETTSTETEVKDVDDTPIKEIESDLGDDLVDDVVDRDEESDLDDDLVDDVVDRDDTLHSQGKHVECEVRSEERKVSEPEEVDAWEPEDSRERDKPKDQKEPVHPPRRSERKRKPPVRYPMMEIQARPYDRKLQSGENLMKSGVLNTMDTDTAHNLIKAVFN